MATTTPTGENKRIVQEMSDRLWNEKDYAVLDDLFADDFVQHGGPMIESELRGAAANREYVEAVHAAFPDFETVVEQQLAEDDLVASRLTYRGTHEGEFMGMAPTGKRAEVPGIVITRLEDGKIAESWVNVDMASWMRQIGLLSEMEA